MIDVRNVLLGLVMLPFLAVPSYAEIIGFDSFANTAGGADYTIGAMAGQTATVGTFGYTGGWSTGTASMQNVSGGLSHDLSPGVALDGQVIAFTSNGTASRRLVRPINYTPTDGTYYFSSLFQKTAVTTTRDMLTGLGPAEGATSSYGSSEATYIGIYNGGFTFTPGGASFTELLTAAEVNVGETYFGLMEIDFSTAGADAIEVSVFDGSSMLVANQTFTGLDLDGDISHFGLASWDFDDFVGVDELRFGTSLGDVMTPEPASIAIWSLLGLSLAGFGYYRTRRKE